MHDAWDVVSIRTVHPCPSPSQPDSCARPAPKNFLVEHSSEIRLPQRIFRVLRKAADPYAVQHHSPT